MDDFGLDEVATVDVAWPVEAAMAVIGVCKLDCGEMGVTRSDDENAKWACSCDSLMGW